MEFALYQFILRIVRVMSSSGQIPIRRHGIRDVEAYDVTADELERIQREGSDVGFDFQIAQFCITLAGSFLTGLILSPPPPTARNTFDVFVVLVVVGFFLGAIFGVKWYRNRGAFSETIRKIKERQIGPVGDEQHQLKASELDELQLVEPPKPPEGSPQ
jgi:hypothetical protein